MMKDYIGVFVLFSTIFMLAGYFRPTLQGEQLCDTPRTRLGYVLPQFSIGCWLSEAPND